MDYQKQANDFLKATETSFKATFKCSETPAWDNYNHDAFTCVLKNEFHKYRFTLYQSRMQSTGTGSNIPNAYDVLAVITKYEIGNFEDFCSEFGYDTDSRSAFKTYKAVMKEWKNVEKLFTPDQLEQLQEIQ